MASNELVGRVWQWQRSDLPGGKSVAVASPERYTLAFQAGGRVLLRADCNRGSGSYEVNGNAMKMGPAATTKMGCPPDSQDGEFLRQLGAGDGLRRHRQRTRADAARRRHDAPARSLAGTGLLRRGRHEAVRAELRDQQVREVRRFLRDRGRD